MRIGKQGLVLAGVFAAAALVILVAALLAEGRALVAVVGLALLAPMAAVAVVVVAAERRVRRAVATVPGKVAAEVDERLAAHAESSDPQALVRDATRRFDRLVRREYRQLEELLALYHEVAPPRALPPTRGWAASPDYQRALFSLVREGRPTTVVECGSGTTTLITARALQANGTGRLVSLEHLAEHAEATREHLARAGLDEVAEVVHAPLVDHDLGGERWRWYDVGTAGALADVGLVVVDGPPRAVGPMSRYPALPLLAAALRPDAQLLLDDADREEELEMIRRWEAEHPGLSWTRLGHEKGTVLVQRGGEGRDH